MKGRFWAYKLNMEEINEEKKGNMARSNGTSFAYWGSSRFLFTVLIASFFGAVFGFAGGRISDELDLGSLKERSGKELNVEKIVVEDSEVTSVVEKSAPSVVSIVITKEVPKFRTFDFFGFGFVPQEDGEMEKQQVGGGTGFFVSDDGLIATNKHVVSDKDAEYTVITNDEKEYSAKVIARDPSHDIALIKIEGKNFPVLELGSSSNVKIGQTVIAIGNSLGEFSNTVSRGIISGLGRTLVAGDGYGSETERLSNIIQTDAAINPGNSGGPLINILGQVVGMNVAMAQGAQNIGFALPIDQVKKVIEQVKSTGKISYPFLGVRFVAIDKEIQQKNSLDYGYGALVQRGATYAELAVMPGSPADKAGIVEGDIILEYNGKKIDEKNQLADLVSSSSVGETVTLKVYHKGQEKEIKVKLEERKQ